MRELHVVAPPELQESLSLAEKPCLTDHFLLGMQIPNRIVMKSLRKSGRTMLPSNRLMRARCMRGGAALVRFARGHDGASDRSPQHRGHDQRVEGTPSDHL